MNSRLYVDGVNWAEQKLYKDSQKSGQENSGNGYRTESFGIILWKFYDNKYRADIIR